MAESFALCAQQKLLYSLNIAFIYLSKILKFQVVSIFVIFVWRQVWIFHRVILSNAAIGLDIFFCKVIHQGLILSLGNSALFFEYLIFRLLTVIWKLLFKVENVVFSFGCDAPTSTVCVSSSDFFDHFCSLLPSFCSPFLLKSNSVSFFCHNFATKKNNRVFLSKCMSRWVWWQFIWINVRIC